MTAQRRVHQKPVVYRRAVVEGALLLTEKSRKAIRAGRVEKGDPLLAGELAGMMAMRHTPELIPHCHSIPLTGEPGRGPVDPNGSSSGGGGGGPLADRS